MLEDNWTGCYREGWGRNRLRPASFAHPAKCSYGLSVRIYEHALEEGWIEPGGVVLDPFAGIGGFALEALRHGLHFVGCELEQRFVGMGQGCDCTGISKADWVRFQGRWDRMRYEGGRHWCPGCLARAGMIANEQRVFVRKFKHPFSPLPLPGTERAVPAKMRQAMLSDATPSTSYARNSGKIPCTSAHRYHGNVETWEAQGMPGTAVIVQGDSRRLGEVLERASTRITEPIYRYAWKNTPRRATLYNRHCRVVARLKMNSAIVEFENGQRECVSRNALRRVDKTAKAELCLSSPPYANSLSSEKHGIDWTKASKDYPGRQIHDERIALYNRHHDERQYGTDPANLGNLPDTGFEAALAEPGHTVAPKEPARGVAALQDTQRVSQGTPSLAISSPPFGAAETRNRTPFQGGDVADMMGRAYTQDRQGMTDGQLGAMPTGDHAAACERPTCAISSPPWESSIGNAANTPETKMIRPKLPDANEVAAYLKQKRMEKGLSLKDIDDYLGTVTLYSWYEGRPIGTQIPTPENWRKLKVLLDLDDRFDSGILTVEKVRATSLNTVSQTGHFQMADYGTTNGQLGTMPPGDHAEALRAEEPKLVTLGNYGIMSSKMEVIQCQTIVKIAENQYRDVPDVASHVAKNMSAKHSKDVKSQRDLEPKLRQPDSTPQCLIAGEKPILIGKAEVFAGEDTLGKSSAVQPLSEMGTNVSSAVPQIISRFTTKKADQRQMEPGTTNLTTSKPCVLPVTLPCTAPPTLRPLAQYVEKNTEQDHGTLVAQKNAEGNLGCVPSGNSTQKQKETLSTFWAASRQILEQVYQVLAPGAHAIFVCKRFVRAKKIVEFPLQWARLCEAVGFKWIHHHKAWLVEDRGAQYTIDGDLEKRTVKHCSFFRRLAESKGSPVIDWEDVLCFVKEAK